MRKEPWVGWEWGAEKTLLRETSSCIPVCAPWSPIPPPNIPWTCLQAFQTLHPLHLHGKHIQPVFKVVKLFLQGGVVNLKGKGLSDSPISQNGSKILSPNTQLPWEWRALFSGTQGLWLQAHSGHGLPHPQKWGELHLGIAEMPH